jgi:hypothetical protein
MASIVARALLPSGEVDQALAARCGLALGLADDPRVDPAGVLERDRGSVLAVLDQDSGGVPIVGHPVRLQLQDGGLDHRALEDPVEVAGVQLGNEVRDADGDAALDSGHQIDDPQGGEGIAGLGDDGWLNVRVGQTGRWLAKRTESRRGSSADGHGDKSRMRG